jgi:hypothetical protein
LNPEGEIMRTFNSLTSRQPLPHLALNLHGGAKTYAAWPVWSESFREGVRFSPLSKAQAVKLYHKARRWNRLKRSNGYGGSIGSAAMRVLESLIFDFLNYRSGRLDPSYAGIARRTGLGRSTVAVALARLKSLGIIHWLRRCVEDRDDDGRFVLRQQTNAYAVLPVSQWHGFQEAADPVPHPTAWGAQPPLPPLVDQAVAEWRDGATTPRVLRVPLQYGSSFPSSSSRRF